MQPVSVNCLPKPISIEQEALPSVPTELKSIKLGNVEIPIMNPIDASSPQRLKPGTHITREHQPSYVVKLTQDNKGNIAVPMVGKHIQKTPTVYAFFTTDAAGNVKQNYYGQTKNPRARLNAYNASFRKVNAGEQGRKVESSICSAAHAFFGVVTLPSTPDSMDRHERAQIFQAFQHSDEVEVLNTQVGRNVLGSFSTPSPIKKEPQIKEEPQKETAPKATKVRKKLDFRDEPVAKETQT